MCFRICEHVQKEKNAPGAKRPPLLGEKRPCVWAFCPIVLSVGISPQTCDYCDNGYLKFNIYEWHGNTANHLSNINRILGKYAWYNSRNLRAMFWVTAYRGVRRPLVWCIAPRYSLARPHNVQQCKLHFEIYTFTHNDHVGYVQFSANLTQKRHSCQNYRVFFINLRPSVVHLPYYNLWLFQNSQVRNLFVDDGHSRSKNSRYYFIHRKHVSK